MRRTQTSAGDRQSIEQGDTYATRSDLPQVFRDENHILTLSREGAGERVDLYYNRQEHEWYKLRLLKDSDDTTPRYTVEKRVLVVDYTINVDDLEKELYSDTELSASVPDEDKESLVSRFESVASEYMDLITHGAGRDDVREMRPLSEGWWIVPQRTEALFEANGVDYTGVIRDTLGITGFVAELTLIGPDDLDKMACQLAKSEFMSEEEARSVVFTKTNFCRPIPEKQLEKPMSEMRQQAEEVKEKLESARSAIAAFEEFEERT